MPRRKNIWQEKFLDSKGRMLTIDVIRQILASRHGADFACPMTAGIFTWIVPMKPKKKAVNESRPTGGRSNSAVNSIPNTLAVSITSKPVLKTKDIT